MTKTKERRPDGLLGFYLIEGMPGMKFLVPERSRAYQHLLNAEKEGQLAHMFPKSQNPRVSLGVTDKVLKEMMFEFDSEGNFETKDAELAIAAYEAAKLTDNRIRPARINPHSMDPYAKRSKAADKDEIE